MKKKSWPPLLKHTAAMKDYVEEQLADSGLDAKKNSQICLAIEEVTVNIVNHSGAPPDSNIDIEISFNSTSVTLRISDHGSPFNPLDAKKPDLEISLQKRKPGGLGIFFVLKLMDKAEYKRVNERNCLILTKNI